MKGFNGKWKVENEKLRTHLYIFHFPLSIFHFKVLLYRFFFFARQTG